MTIDEFLAELERKTRERGVTWRAECGMLRCADRVPLWATGLSLLTNSHAVMRAMHCPISFVTGRPSDYMDPIDGGVRIGLPSSVAMDLAAAADGLSTIDHRVALRARLFAACGLPPEAA